MGFLETVGATALGAAIPVLVARWLDRREQARFGKSGLGRYMAWLLGDADARAGAMADEMRSRRP
jgi:hypothetical protein